MEDKLLCNAKDCSKKRKRTGGYYCSMHVWRKHYKGDLYWKPTTQFERAMSRIKKKAGCWEYVGKKDVAGYGSIVVNWKRTPAHRFFYEKLKGIIPAGKFVLHHCDNKPCVNPDHLYVGTKKDNYNDALKRNRLAPEWFRKGRSNAKL